MECNKECSTCQSECAKHCPVCGQSALGVESATVLNLSKVNIKPERQFYICLNPKCKTIYFDEQEEQIIVADDVKVPIWFKSNFMNYMICYCRQIYLKDVIRAVLSMNDEPTIDNVVKFLEKENIETNCLINNPISRDCDLLFNNAIEYAIDLKKREDKENVK